MKKTTVACFLWCTVTAAQCAPSGENDRAKGESLAQVPSVACQVAPAKLRNPVDDVLGVWPGMALDAAIAAVRCSDAGLSIRDASPRVVKATAYGLAVRTGIEAANASRAGSSPRAEARANRLDLALGVSRNAIQASEISPGQTRWLVAAFGPPAQERVLHVYRKERFAADAQPALDAVDSAMQKKYGEPSQVKRPENKVFGQATTFRYLWVYGVSGRKFPKSDWLPSDCAGASIANDGSMQYYSGCGLIVSIAVRTTPSNPSIVDQVEVTAVNMALASEILDTADEALARLDAERIQREQDDAKRRVTAPRF